MSSYGYSRYGLRRYRSKRYTGYRRRRYSSYRPTSIKRAIGNSIAAYQQRDSSTVVINRITTASITVPNGASNAGYYFSLWNELIKSQFYPNYSSMYDQMKMISALIKVTGFAAASATTINISPQVVTAFDRNGIDNVVTSTGGEGEQPAVTTYTPQDINYDLISTYSSAQLRSWSLGNSFVTSRRISPSTLAEKSMYVSTVQPSALQLGTTDGAASAGANNLCNPFQDQSYPYKPIFFIGVDQGVSNASATSTTYTFKVEMEFSVVFRGMRKPSSVYSEGEGATGIIPGGSTETASNVSLVPYTNVIEDNGPFLVYSPPGVAYNVVSLTINVPQEIIDQEVPEYKLTNESIAIYENKTVTVTPPEGYDGLTQVTITTDVPQNPLLTRLEQNITKNGDYTFTAPAEYDGLSTVQLHVDIPSSPSVPNFVITGVIFSGVANIPGFPNSLKQYVPFTDFQYVGPQVSVAPQRGLISISRLFSNYSDVLYYSVVVYASGTSNIYLSDSYYAVSGPYNLSSTYFWLAVDSETPVVPLYDNANDSTRVGYTLPVAFYTFEGLDIVE